MGRLEEKLKELGYIKTCHPNNIEYKKAFCEGIEIFAFATKECIGVVYCESNLFVNEEQINTLKKAYNQLQSDLKELEQCQD